MRELFCVGQQEDRSIPAGKTHFYPLSFVEAYYYYCFSSISSSLHSGVVFGKLKYLRLILSCGFYFPLSSFWIIYLLTFCLALPFMLLVS